MNTDDTHPSRREYLGTAGGLGVALAAGYAGYRTLPAGQSEQSRPQARPPEQREDFLWLGSRLWRDEAIRDNLFAFARRHDLAVVLVAAESSGESLAETLRPQMVAAGEFGLDVWLNVGLFADVPVPEFVAGGDGREAHLDRLRGVARAHGDLFDSGRIILWQEAPVMGQWVEGGAWNEAAVDNLVEFGPEVFDAQKRAIEAVNDALEVGLFVHFPYIVDSKRPEVFATLARGLRRRNAVPDFGFTDFYRGWYEKDVGPGPANAAVRSLVSNARAALENRPVFYLGQSHTINPNHTPSKQAMRMNVRASNEAGAAGLGWYARDGYVPTKNGFDPFVPNVSGAELEGDSITTITIARDRFLYSWLATLETSDGFDADDAFDLWLIGDDFGLYDHRLSVRTAGGDWEYVGDFGGYANGEYPDGSKATHRATVFRALDRDRLLEGGALDCRVETAGESSGAELRAAFVMPCDPSAYVSEREAAAFARGNAPLEAVSLGRTSATAALAPGETRRWSIPVGDSGGSLERLRHPEYADQIDRLAALEEDGIDPSARFDLWVSGSGLDDPSAAMSIVDRDGTARAPADVGIVASTGAVAICHGLERERFLGDGGLDLKDDADASVEAVYAMPFAGSATFRSPAHAAELLAEQPGEARIFCIDHATPE